MAVPTIKALLILDSSDGTRLHAKYYAPEMKEIPTQLAFEKNLFTKSRNQPARNDAEIVMLENTISVYRTGHDCNFYVVGDISENELILATVLEGMYGCLSGILRSRMEKRVLLDNLELVFLTVDELVDGGLILEVDPLALSNRVLMRDAAGAAPGGDVVAGELTFSQAFSNAREQFARSFGA